MLIVERPRTAPISLLIVFVSLLVAQLVVLSHTQTSHRNKDIPLALAPVAAFIGIFVILNMPLRDPLLPDEDISQPFSKPTVKLRTPEDNLTPWQYMTVSWMRPLVKKGVTTQLDGEDVWDLGYEFKHGRLHSAFRTLQGSVTNRLLQANGMDLIRTTTLALLKLCSGMFYILRTFNERLKFNSTPGPGGLTASPWFNERWKVTTKRHHYICCACGSSSSNISTM